MDRAILHLSKHPKATRVGFSLALVFACFTLASTSYLAWLYRLMEFAPSLPVEAVTMVGGYLCQAFGIGCMSLLMHKSRSFSSRLPFITAIAIHFAVAAAAMLATTPESLMALGFAMNFFYGVVCAFYLRFLAWWVPHNRRGLALGGGYACSIVCTWAFSLAQGGSPIGATESVVVCAALSLIAMAMIAASCRIGFETATDDTRPETAQANSAHVVDKTVQRAVTGELPSSIAKPRLAQSGESTQDASGAVGALSDSPKRSFADGAIYPNIAASTITLACLAVLLLSLVKGIGYVFPASDLVEGFDLEASRLFYAAGLLIAGFIADANRRTAALCCIAALVFPFGCLALANEPIPETILWAANYLFFGFFSVYRILLFCDLAQDSGREHFAGFGLLFGRIGDALGTALWLALNSNPIALIAVATVLFAATIFAFYHLLLQLYPAKPETVKSEEDHFEEFAAAYGISMREREVLRLVLAERTNSEVASELFITEGTVKYHVHNLFKKTNCTNRRELIAKYHEKG